MMTKKELSNLLESLHLGGWQYHLVVDSTNDIALAWGRAGGPDWGLVVADQQLKGRGRNNRTWVTKSGVSLAFSLVLRPTLQEQGMLTWFTALGALSLIRSLSLLGLKAEIKWPNDVLLKGKKVAGVLAETEWEEDQLQTLVVGMGVNVKPQALPPADVLRYPAVSVEEVLGLSINRWELLASVIQMMMTLRKSLPYPEFLNIWNTNLAFRGQEVPIHFPDNVLREMRVLGVKADGQLELQNEMGEKVVLTAGEIVPF